MWLIASLADQISRNPIVIYRDDTPIDITKVEIKMNNWLKQNISPQIPFPAFSLCEINDEDFDDTEIRHLWQDYFVLPVHFFPTELGKCMTLNFHDREKFYSDEVSHDRQGWTTREHADREIKPENQAAPYMTTSAEFGFDAVMYIETGIYAMYEKLSPFNLVIHSPFEMPTKANQRFLMAEKDYNTFFVTPQLSTIDESMTAMEPQK